MEAYCAQAMNQFGGVTPGCPKSAAKNTVPVHMPRMTKGELAIPKAGEMPVHMPPMTKGEPAIPKAGEMPGHVPSMGDYGSGGHGSATSRGQGGVSPKSAVKNTGLDLKTNWRHPHVPVDGEVSFVSTRTTKQTPEN